MEVCGAVLRVLAVATAGLQPGRPRHGRSLSVYVRYGLWREGGRWVFSGCLRELSYCTCPFISPVFAASDWASGGLDCGECRNMSGQRVFGHRNQKLKRKHAIWWAPREPVLPDCVLGIFLGRLVASTLGEVAKLIGVGGLAIMRIYHCTLDDSLASKFPKEYELHRRKGW